MQRVDSQADRLTLRIRDGVAEGFARVIPNPPFAFHVVWVRDFPIRSPGQWNACNRAIAANRPDRARRKIEISPPDLFRFRNIFVGCAFDPMLHDL